MKRGSTAGGRRIRDGEEAGIGSPPDITIRDSFIVTPGKRYFAMAIQASIKSASTPRPTAAAIMVGL
ncbi:MAG: hypothetical protein PVH30_09840 [Desulfobacterales bacterium]